MKARATSPPCSYRSVAVALAASACGERRAGRLRRRAPPPRRWRRRRSADGISAERCEANKAAGKITYLSSFDFAASPSIVDVVMADKKGYFDKLCLDVDLKSELLHRQLPARGRQPGPVQLGRLVHRDAHLTPRTAPSFVARGRLRQVEHRGPPGARRRQDQPAERPEGQDDRREGRPAAGARGHAQQGRAAAGRGLQGGAARRLRPEGPPAAGRSTRCPSTSRTSPASSTGPASSYKLFDPSADGHPRHASASSTRASSS